MTRRRSRPTSTDWSVAGGPPGRSPALAIALAVAGAIIVILAVIVLAGSGPDDPPTASGGPTGSSGSSADTAPPTSPGPTDSSDGPSTDAPSTDAASPSAPAEIAGVPCEPIESLEYHVHSHLELRWDGASQTVPPGIGITDRCLYWLHTHDGSGIVHVEAPVARAFTLGQFFDVWGEPLERDRVAGRVAGPGEQVYAFLDGSPWAADPRDIPLSDLAAIELQVGVAPLDPIPFSIRPLP